MGIVRGFFIYFLTISSLWADAPTNLPPATPGEECRCECSVGGDLGFYQLVLTCMDMDPLMCHGQVLVFAPEPGSTQTCFGAQLTCIASQSDLNHPSGLDIPGMTVTEWTTACISSTAIRLSCGLTAGCLPPPGKPDKDQEPEPTIQTEADAVPMPREVPRGQVRGKLTIRDLEEPMP